MARRQKPFDPAKATEAALIRREREAEAKRLREMGATVTTDRAGNILSAYRSNVFTRLRDAKPTPAIDAGQHDAAMRLCELWAQWKGLDGKVDAPIERVDEPTKERSHVTDRMLRAGSAVNEALGGIGPMDRELLTAFLVATVEEDRPMDWRGIVQRVTGEDRRERQVVMVVSALENLRRHFQEPRKPTSWGSIAA